MAWIKSILNEDILCQVVHVQTAQELGTYLQDSFSKVAKVKILELRSELQNLRRGQMSLMKFCNKIQFICSELSLVGYKVENKDKVLQVMNGLQDEYSVFVTTSMISKPPPYPTFDIGRSKQ